MPSDEAALFGRGDSNDRPALVELVSEGSLLIANVEQLVPAVRQAVVRLASDRSWQSLHQPGMSHPFRGRMLITAEQAIPELMPVVQMIRVPPMRVRRQDLGEWMRYGIRQQSLRLGWQQAPTLHLPVMKELPNHDFLYYRRELEALIERVLQQVRLQGD